MSHHRKAFSFFACVCMSICATLAASELTPQQIEKDLEKNKQPLVTLDPANNRWKAEEIGITGNKKANTWREDYATITYGKAWDFEDELPKKLKGKKYVKDFRLEDGKLKYTTEEDAEIFWGDHYQKNPEYGEEAIAATWWGHWMPIHVTLRIKQSLPESDWEISMRKGNSKFAYRSKKKFKIRGTDWQTVDVKMGDSRSFFASLSIKTVQANNKIEIDEVSVYTPHLTRTFRKTFEIKGGVDSAAFCVNAAPKYKVYINNQLACAEEQNSRMPGLLNRYTDMGRFFHPGKNEIRVEAETKNWSRDQEKLLIEGIVYQKSGDTILLKTDSTWEGCYLAPKSGSETAEWKPVRVIGKVKAHFGHREGSSYFLNPPHYGRIRTKPFARREPIFRPGEKVEFNVTLYGKGLKAESELNYSITDALNDEAQVKSGNVLASCSGEKLKTLLSFVPPHAGVYNITLSLKEKGSGKLIEDTVFEAAVVGKIEQDEIAGTSADEGLQKKLIQTIDCTKYEDTIMYCGSRQGKEMKPELVEKPFGKYIVTGTKLCDFFSWRLEFANYSRPHMIEVDYPDDDSRIIGISMGSNSYYSGICNDHGNNEWPFGASGAYTGFQNPLTNRMRTMKAVVFPQMPVATIDIVNFFAGSRAAVSAIRVYEIENELPALKFATPTSRLTGVHAERITELPNTYYNGEMDRIFCDGHELCSFPFHGFYKSWYITNRNLIKYMRFCGENTLIAGILMYYHGNMYPSKNKNNMFYGTSAQADMASLLGEMFAANNLNLLLGVEYSLPGNLFLKNRVTDEMVANGARCYGEMYKTGKQVITWHKIGNINEQEIQDGLYDAFKDFCELYRDNPGIKGIAMQQGRAFHPTFPMHNVSDPLDTGYSDTTTFVFEKETGIKIPVDYSDPKRFAKRHQWLTTNALEEWIDWRCGKIYEISHRLGTMMKRANPDWTLFIFNGSGIKTDMSQGFTRTDFLRRSGFWPPMYNDPMFCIGRYYPESIRQQADAPGMYVKSQLFTSSPEIIETYNKGMTRTALRTGPQFYEPHLRIPKGKWYWERTLNGSYCLPTSENISRMYSRLLYKETPYFILQYWTDMNLASGFEHERRIFNRAFTVLPEGEYKDLTGNGLDDNCVIRTDGNYFYIINLIPEKMEFTLSAKGANQIRDLATGEVVRISRGKGKITLAANALGVYALDSGSLTAAASECPQRIIDECQDESGEIMSLAQSIKGKLASNSIAREKAEMAGEFVALAESISADINSEKFGKAWRTLKDYKIKTLLAEAKDLATPINWLLIGPFENKNREGFEKVFDIEKDLLSGIMEDEYTGASGEKVKWRHVLAKSAGEFRGIVNLREYFGEACNFEVAYAFTQIFCPEETPVELLLGSDDGLKVWLNSELVFTVKPERGLTPAEDSAEAVFKKGWNRVVLKIENNVGGWDFSFDPKTRDGKDIPGLEYAHNRK